MAAAAARSTRVLKSLVSKCSSHPVDPLRKVNAVANFSTASATHAAKTVGLKNRPLSPFLSQKRPEKSSTLSIGERFALIVTGLVILPAPEIAKFSQFMY